MKKIRIVAIILLLATASLIAGCQTVDSGQASVAEVTQALGRCYALQFLPDKTDELGNFTVKDVELGNRTTWDLAGRHITFWHVTAKVYDAKGQYVENLDENLIKTDVGGWVCQ